MRSKRWSAVPDALAATLNQQARQALTTVAVNGAGLVGCCAACALADVGLQVLLVGRKPPPASVDRQTAAALDERPVVVSAASARVLDRLAGWSRLRPLVAPIQRIHVSEQQRGGIVHLDAARFGLTAFGYVVDANTLGAVLTKMTLERRTAITVVDADLRDFSCADKEAITLQLACADGDRQTLSAALLVAADGGDSQLRQKAGIGVTRRVAAAQAAVVCTLTLAQDYPQQAFERFTASGLIALLPMRKQRYGLVWSLPADQAAVLATQDEASFCHALQALFGGRLGAISAVSERRIHTLDLLAAHAITAPRTVLIGNAAQVLHPVAGQGFNLGVRDAAWLAQSCADAQRRRIALGGRLHLQRYAASRAADHRWVRQFTQGLVTLFSNHLVPLTWLRGLGLHAVACVPLLQSLLVAQASGLAAIPAHYRLPKPPP